MSGTAGGGQVSAHSGPGSSWDRAQQWPRHGARAALSSYRWSSYFMVKARGQDHRGLPSVYGTPKQALPLSLTAAGYVLSVKSLAPELKKQK